MALNLHYHRSSELGRHSPGCVGRSHPPCTPSVCPDCPPTPPSLPSACIPGRTSKDGNLKGFKGLETQERGRTGQLPAPAHTQEVQEVPKRQPETYQGPKGAAPGTGESPGDCLSSGGRSQKGSSVLGGRGKGKEGNLRRDEKEKQGFIPSQG